MKYRECCLESFEMVWNMLIQPVGFTLVKNHEVTLTHFEYATRLIEYLQIPRLQMFRWCCTTPSPKLPRLTVLRGMLNKPNHPV